MRRQLGHYTAIVNVLRRRSRPSLRLCVLLLLLFPGSLLCGQVRPRPLPLQSLVRGRMVRRRFWLIIVSKQVIQRKKIRTVSWNLQVGLPIKCISAPKTKPVKPGFLSTHKPGFTGLKIGGLPGFSGTRVPGFHSLVVTGD